jgi:hypothetical protein
VNCKKWFLTQNCLLASSIIPVSGKICHFRYRRLSVSYYMARNGGQPAGWPVGSKSQKFKMTVRFYKGSYCRIYPSTSKYFTCYHNTRAITQNIAYPRFIIAWVYNYYVIIFTSYHLIMITSEVFKSRRVFCNRSYIQNTIYSYNQTKINVNTNTGNSNPLYYWNLRTNLRQHKPNILNLPRLFLWIYEQI